ncbi:nitroreductase family protein [Methanocella sp. MCL-LM]|uniref:nitroreductase family protein n=1 Tax=Methanocella sp. MCL-LM TaxID=3412035 RepID=UPI003C754754
MSLVDLKTDNPVLSNIYSRRSIRNFTPEPVPDEIIEEIIKAGTYAPSAVNKQPWRFVIVKNRELIHRYAEQAKKGWLKLYQGSDDPERQGLVKFMSSLKTDIFYDAPVLVLVFSSPDAFRGDIDCTLAAGNMMLAAHSMGIGSCWIGLAMALGSDPAFLEEIGVPQDYKLIAPLIFGYPEKKSPRAPARNRDVVLKWIE